MKALLLAGGFGTRLRPLTLTRPKHLLPIANRPHIEHVFDLLLRHGVDEVVLTTSYLAESFAVTVEQARERGLTVEVTHESEPLGTAGALKNAEAEVGGDTFLVFNADVLTDVDLGRVVAFHRDRDAEATILLSPVDDPSPFGVVPTAGDGRVTGFIEKPAQEDAPTNLINAGVYVLEPSVLAHIPAGREWSAERALFPGLVSQGSRLFALATDAYWIDVGTPEKYLQANMDAIEGRFSMDDGNAVHPDAHVATEARVSSSCVGSGCVIEPGARVERSVLLRGVKVAAGATVKRSIIGEGAAVLGDVDVDGVTIGDFEQLG